MAIRWLRFTSIYGITGEAQPDEWSGQLSYGVYFAVIKVPT